LALLLFLAAAAIAGSRAEDKAPPKYTMKTFQLVLLRQAGSPKFMDERVVQATQEAYLAWLKKLHAVGTVLVSGPIEKGGDLRGAMVLDVPTKAEAETVVKDDPWVKAGRDVPEVHPWWAADGIMRKTTDVTRLTARWIGLLNRPPSAPQYPKEKLEEIQKGHMANINKMADSGDLAIAGPMGEDGVLRGIFVFRTDEPERLKTLCAEDPAVKAGRLAVELYRWAIPEGAIP
jgi:uncharacterized protein YciI